MATASLSPTIQPIRKNASVDSFAGRWFLAGLAGMLGGFFLLIGIALIVLGRVLTRRIITNSKP